MTTTTKQPVHTMMAAGSDYLRADGGGSAHVAAGRAAAWRGPQGHPASRQSHPMRQQDLNASLYLG